MMRRALLTLGSVALLAAVAAAAVPPYDFSRVYPREQDFQQSIKVYQDALQANPNDAQAAYWLGVAYWETSVYYRDGKIEYGAGYLDKAIGLLERAVQLDDKNMGAWMALSNAYFTRGGPGPSANWLYPRESDFDKSRAAEEKVIALSMDPSANNRAVPRPGSHNSEVTNLYIPLGDRNVRFRPGDLYVIGDLDTRLVYHFPCASMPVIAHPQIFLSKWEAYNRGYRAAAVCPPP
jgi:tetratricopeptide (TPR) repeat protein